VVFHLDAVECAVVDVVRGVNAEEQRAVRFEDAMDLGEGREGRSPWEVVEREGRDYAVEARVSERQRTPVVELQERARADELARLRERCGGEVGRDYIEAFGAESGSVVAGAAAEFEDDGTPAKGREIGARTIRLSFAAGVLQQQGHDHDVRYECGRHDDDRHVIRGTQMVGNVGARRLVEGVREIGEADDAEDPR